MCSIILRIDAGGISIGANRDEMISRLWDPPARHWPDFPRIIAGRDRTAGGTWLGINQHGMAAAVLNRHGTLGPAADKRSRGELPLFALAEPDLAAATRSILTLNAAEYRSFNLVIADAGSAIFIRGQETGAPDAQSLHPGTWMITSGEPNERSAPRIARHLPKFEQTDPAAWPALLADNTPPATSALNIPPHDGFGTVSSSLITLPKTGSLAWLFSAGPPHLAPFEPLALV